MKIYKGIKGIRKFLADDTSGWHVWIDGDYYEYSYDKVSEIFSRLSNSKVAVYYFTGWTGNNLFFNTVPQEN